MGGRHGMMCFPTAVVPTKVMPLMSGCVNRRLASLLAQLMTFRTPSGTPALCKAPPTAKAVRGVVLETLSTMQFRWQCTGAHPAHRNHGGKLKEQSRRTRRWVHGRGRYLSRLMHPSGFHPSLKLEWSRQAQLVLLPSGHLRGFFPNLSVLLGNKHRQLIRVFHDEFSDSVEHLEPAS